jgi:predicted DNA-binding transcriptional regulator YafY
MPVNKNALIRYLAIDRYLRQHRFASMEDLRGAILDALEDSRQDEEAENENDNQEEITISDRTIYADLNVMRKDRGLKWEAPILTNRSDNTYYYDPQFVNYSIWDNNFLLEESLALQMAARIMNAFRGTQICSRFSDLFKRITRSEKRIPDFSQHIPYKYFRFENEDEPVPILATIVKAIFSEVLELAIEVPEIKETKKSFIHPYRLEYIGGSWVLTGYSSAENRIERIRICNILNAYSRPEMQFERRPF